MESPVPTAAAEELLAQRNNAQPTRGDSAPTKRSDNRQFWQPRRGRAPDINGEGQVGLGRIATAGAAAAHAHSEKSVGKCAANHDSERIGWPQRHQTVSAQSSSWERTRQADLSELGDEGRPLPLPPPVTLSLPMRRCRPEVEIEEWCPAGGVPALGPPDSAAQVQHTNKQNRPPIKP